jgi:hypothetical protein
MTEIKNWLNRRILMLIKLMRIKSFVLFFLTLTSLGLQSFAPSGEADITKIDTATKTNNKNLFSKGGLKPSEIKAIKEQKIRKWKQDAISRISQVHLSPSFEVRIPQPPELTKPTLAVDVPEAIRLAKEGSISCGNDIDRYRTILPKDYVFASKQTAQDGPWNVGSTWVGGSVPLSTDSVQILSGHTVTIPSGYTANIAGFIVEGGGELIHDPSGSNSLVSTRNGVIKGLYKSDPISSSVVHTLTFSGINENNFVGGGLDVKESDVGLWVMEGGILYLRGAAKTPHTNATGSVAAGATSMTVASAVGWKVGDEIVICPTEDMDLSGGDWNTTTNTPIYPWHAEFERRILTSVSANTVGWTTPLAHAHNSVSSSIGAGTYAASSRTWTAEVINLSRNVKIRGTSTGRTHIFIRNSIQATQLIEYVELQHMGPRKIDPAIHASIPALVSGRYYLHFHFGDYFSQGSIVYGVSIYDGGNRGFVPHETHRITMSNSSAFNLQENGFWWDEGEQSHYTTWEDNIVAGMTFNGLANSRTSAYQINQGDGNAIRRCKSVGNYYDDEHGGGGYMWEANSEGVWIFEDNLSHSEITGLWVWQNTSMNHTVKMYDSYNNQNGIVHGAYTNAYEFIGGHHFRSKLFLEATSAHSGGVRYKNVYWDANNEKTHAIEIVDSPVPPETSGSRDLLRSNRFIECVFRGFTTQPAKIIGGDGPENTYKIIDFINCDLGGASPGYTFALFGSTVYDGWLIRVQNLSGANHQMERVSGSWVTTAPADFAPRLYGNGILGLRGEYYNGYEFNDSAFTRNDALLMFEVWDPDPNILPDGVHHLITNYNVFSAKWFGFIEPYRTGSHTFSIGADRKRMWITIGGVETQIINDWVSTSPNTVTSSPVSLTAGVQYPVRIEMSSVSTGAKGIQLFWDDPFMTIKELIPPSQLFGRANEAPIANAGADQTLASGVTAVKLSGNKSYEPDGSIATYSWSRISGPNTPTMIGSALGAVDLTGAVDGIYVYRLTTTDDFGLTDTDDITITIGSGGNISPTAAAGSDQVIHLPTSQVTVNASSSLDPDGTIADYTWSKVSGPSTFTITDDDAAITTITGLVQGTYVFRVTVTDDDAATAMDDVQIKVNTVPVANAGSDQVIHLPTTSGTVNASSSTDADGTISGYAWTRISGPNTPTIVSASSASTNITGMIAGTYVFQIQVTDNDGATHTDQVQIIINQLPVANAGSDQIIHLPTTSGTVNASSSSDADGTISAYAWTRISGPNTPTIVSASSASTNITGMIAGTYVFQVQVTDNRGATHTDQVQIIINQLPVANAGNDQVIVLPISFVTVNAGSSSDADGTISAYAWTRISGPNTPTIVSASSASTNITGMIAGTYVFQIQVTDNDGATHTDQVQITVNTTLTSRHYIILRRKRRVYQ